jgi:hypothetical protein
LLTVTFIAGFGDHYKIVMIGKINFMRAQIAFGQATLACLIDECVSKVAQDARRKKTAESARPEPATF